MQFNHIDGFESKQFECMREAYINFVKSSKTATAPPVNKLVADSTKADSLCTHVGQYNLMAANFLFHCLHGQSLYDKRLAFANCASLLFLLAVPYLTKK
jgi:hypothetical protein